LTVHKYVLFSRFKNLTCINRFFFKV
jgi:hypothetical protein